MVCPAVGPSDLLAIRQSLMEHVYSVQESQFLLNENFIERKHSFGLLEKMFDYLFSNEGQQHKQQESSSNAGKQKGQVDKRGGALAASTIEMQMRGSKNMPQGSVKSSIHEFYSTNYEFREIISMNVQMKARPLLAILFVCIFAIVLYRLTKRSENSKQKVPKMMSLFWFFATIQLYLELNWLSLEPQPKSYSKVLFLGLVPLEQASNYVPEILNLLLFLICLFYFFSLIFRFNEIFGQDDFLLESAASQQQQQQAYFDQLNQSLNKQQAKDRKGRQGGQGQHTVEKEEFKPVIIEPESDDDFSLNGFATQPIMQVFPLAVKNTHDFYHFLVLHLALFLTFLKLALLCEGLLFVRVTPGSVPLAMIAPILDNLEIFPLTPRYLALFTVSFFAASEFIGKTPTDRTQYNFQKRCPYFIAALHSAILVMRRRYLFTLDDLVVLTVFVVHLALYLAIEYRQPLPFKKKLSNAVNGEPLFTKNQKIVIKNIVLKNTEERKEQMSQFDNNYSEEDDIYSSSDSQSVQNNFEESKTRRSGGVTSSNSNQELQDLFFKQLREMSNEDQRKLFQVGGDFDLSNDQDLIRKLNLLAQIKQSNSQQQATQGQQQPKQTAHKAPTKAPTGRPNPRKRR